MSQLVFTLGNWNNQAVKRSQDEKEQQNNPKSYV
jgi:hypothetical protein